MYMDDFISKQTQSKDKVKHWSHFWGVSTSHKHLRRLAAVLILTFAPKSDVRDVHGEDYAGNPFLAAFVESKWRDSCWSSRFRVQHCTTALTKRHNTVVWRRHQCVSLLDVTFPLCAFFYSTSFIIYTETLVFQILVFLTEHRLIHDDKKLQRWYLAPQNKTFFLCFKCFTQQKFLFLIFKKWHFKHIISITCWC